MSIANSIIKKALLFMLWLMQRTEPCSRANLEYTLTRFDDQFLLILTYIDGDGEQQTTEAVGNGLEISRAIHRVEAKLVLDGGEDADR